MKTIIVVSNSYEEAIAELTARMNDEAKGSEIVIENETNFNTAPKHKRNEVEHIENVKTKQQYKKGNVFVYDKNENLLFSRKTFKDAAAILGCDSSTLTGAVKNNSIVLKKYIIKTFDDALIDTKKIAVSDPHTKRLFGIFNNTAEAAEATGYTIGTMRMYVLHPDKCKKLTITRL